MVHRILSRRLLGKLGLGAALSLASVSSGFAAESLLDRARTSGINVGVYNFVPWSYLNPAGEMVGHDIDLLRHVLKEMGITKVDVTPTEWGNLIPGLNAGRFDVVAAGMYVNPPRCEQVVFSVPTFAIRHAFVVMKGNPHGVTDYASAAEKNLRVGVIEGSAYAGYLQDSGLPDANIFKVPDNPTGMAALRAGRIDAWTAGNVGMSAVVEGQSDLEITPVFSKVMGVDKLPHGAFAFRKADADFVEQFNAVLAPVIGSAVHLEIMKASGLSKNELPILSTEQLCQAE